MMFLAPALVLACSQQKVRSGDVARDLSNLATEIESRLPEKVDQIDFDKRTLQVTLSSDQVKVVEKALLKMPSIGVLNLDDMSFQWLLRNEHNSRPILYFLFGLLATKDIALDKSAQVAHTPPFELFLPSMSLRKHDVKDPLSWPWTVVKGQKHLSFESIELGAPNGIFSVGGWAGALDVFKKDYIDYLVVGNR